MKPIIESEARLSVWEATSIIIGHSIGGGIMAVPFLAARNSFVSVVLIILAAFFCNVLLHFMIAELSYNCGGLQMVKCFETFLFRGRGKTALTWAAFALFGFSVIINISGYIIGAAEAIVALVPMPLWLAETIFFALAGGVVLFGLKAVGIFEKYTVLLIYGIVALLAVAVAFVPWAPLPAVTQSANAALALFGMGMFALAANQSVIQAVKGLGGEAKKIRLSIVLGIGLDAVLVLALTTATLLGSQGQVTELALLGLSRGVGSWAVWIGSLFTALALVTTFWSSTLNLRDIVHEQLHLGNKLCWLLAALPSFLIAVLGLGTFLSFT
ncbi:aromatic amino acid transport family protein, partial [Allofournierella sp.]